MQTRRQSPYPKQQDLVARTFLPFHLHVAFLTQVLQQIAALKVLIRVHNCFQLVRGHYAFILCLLHLCLMQMLKNPSQLLARRRSIHNWGFV